MGSGGLGSVCGGGVRRRRYSVVPRSTVRVRFRGVITGPLGGTRSDRSDRGLSESSPCKEL